MKKYLMIFVLLFLLVGCTEKTTYNVVFQSNGGTSVAAITTDGVTLPNLEAPLKDGFTFDGWYLDNDTFSNPFTPTYINDHPITANITVFAKWNPNTYSIFFEENGGSVVEDISGLYQSPVSLPTPEKNQYTFIGWFYDSNLISEATLTTIPLGDVTLYASWEVNAYTITFDENGGEEVSDITASMGSPITLPTPIKNGYIFDGWYLGLEGDAFLETVMPGLHIDVIAKWVPTNVTLSYETYGGSFVSPLIASVDSAIIAPYEPTRDGYSFGGWFSDVDFQQYFVFDTMPLENLTLYAKWNQNPTLETYAYDTIRSIAYAYFYQGVQMQYDQGSGRRMVKFNPEQATSNNYLYMDCSSFANSVLQYAFGINMTPTTNFSNASTASYIEYARVNQNISPEVIYYIENANYTTVPSQTAILSTVRNNLQPGDFIVYRRNNNSAGHIMMYVGDDMFIHSTGSDYNYTNSKETLESNGTVLELDASELFTDTMGARYLFKSNVNRFCVLRPMNREGISFTPSAMSRYHLEGLDIEKTASIPNLGSVSLGEEITYTILLENKGNKNLGYFQVNDEVGTYANFISANYEGIVDGYKITFNLPGISAHSTITLQYTIRVTEETSSSGELLVSDQGKLDEIELNPVYHTIISLSDDELTELTQIIYNKIQSASYTASIDLYQAIYQEFALTIEGVNPLTSFMTLTTIYNDSNLQVDFLYGGKTYNQSQTYNRDVRVRFLMTSHFTVGDILFLYNGSSFKSYIFNGIRFVYLDTAVTLVKQLSTETDIQALLESVQGYQSYRIIRPTLEM
ncbi:MAG: InlB B-repeat-containing protein [Bacilli bacterium]|nr:InlB B-repeat-containing protein [Bacilli bacterium]